MPQRCHKWNSIQYLQLVLVLMSSSAVWADCTDVPQSEATCIPINLYYETDPSGIGDYARFTGTWFTGDSINHPTLADNSLHGPIRWSIDGIFFAESGIAGTNRAFRTFLLLDDFETKLADAGIVLTADSQVFAEYIGEESYSGQDSLCGQPGHAVCKVAFQGAAAFSDLQPRRVVYQAWDTTISTDKNTVPFAESFTITTRWDLPGEFEQLGIKGRFYLFERDNMLGTVPVVIGTRHRYTVATSTLAPGNYSFDAMYVGTEGKLNVVGSDSVTVTPPKQSIRLAVIPGNPVTRAGAQGAPQVCARGAGDTLPAELSGAAVLVDIYVLYLDGAADIPATSQTISLAADGCAAIATVGLAPGRYSIDAKLVESDALLRATAGGPLTIVNEDPNTDVAFQAEPGAGTQPIGLTLIAPRVAATEAATAANGSYIAVRPGIVFQAEFVDAAAAINPGGLIQLFINGQFTSHQFLVPGGAAYVTFPSLELADGEYLAVLAYSGDTTYAPQTGAAVSLEVTADSVTMPRSQDGLEQPVAILKDAFDLELSIDVSNIIDGEPFALTGRLLSRDPDLPKGVPAGTLVFLNGENEIGRAAIAGYSAAILLPDGLPPGAHDLRVEFRK